MEQKRTPSWRLSVYKQADDDDRIPDDWRRISASVRQRDRYRCQACKVRGRYLSAHHIIPRSHGGSNDPGNLIALCEPCHDEAETLGLCTYSTFYRWLNNHAPGRELPPETPTKPSAPRNDWRLWVYGGYGRPQRG